ncbi:MULTISPECIES: hypothetical protein [Kitasatospora]|uniref:Uncharacterized protein n=1 Tax=Kitasatospora cystarginea TaxID=58350 RepID=A0ABN3F3B6_9ACTN
MWWRFGRPGRHFLIEALDNPGNRAAYDLRQKACEKKARQDHREVMPTLACADCGQVPEQESTYEYGLHGQWTRGPGGRCYHEHEERQEKAAANRAGLQLSCPGTVSGRYRIPGSGFRPWATRPPGRFPPRRRHG